MRSLIVSDALSGFDVLYLLDAPHRLDEPRGAAGLPDVSTLSGLALGAVAWPAGAAG